MHRGAKRTVSYRFRGKEGACTAFVYGAFLESGFGRVFAQDGGRVEFPQPSLDVAREIPVARSTRPMPPCPSARASLAAHSRRERSVNTDTSAACLARSVAKRTPHGTRRPVAVQAILISYFLTGP